MDSVNAVKLPVEKKKKKNTLSFKKPVLKAFSFPLLLVVFIAFFVGGWSIGGIEKDWRLLPGRIPEILYGEPDSSPTPPPPTTVDGYKYPLSASMLSIGIRESNVELGSTLGLSGFNVSRVVDGVTTGSGAWSCHNGGAGSDTGAYVQIDLGEGNAQEFIGARMFTSCSHPAAYAPFYSDDGTNWKIVDQGNTLYRFTPSLKGWNAITWGKRGAHRYWRLMLNGHYRVGCWVIEMEMYTKDRPRGQQCSSLAASKANPKPGDKVTFTCNGGGAVKILSNLFSTDFRILYAPENSSSYTTKYSKNGVAVGNGGKATYDFTLPYDILPGFYKTQCRICAKGVLSSYLGCTEWGKAVKK